MIAEYRAPAQATRQGWPPSGIRDGWQNGHSHYREILEVRVSFQMMGGRLHRWNSTDIFVRPLPDVDGVKPEPDSK